MDRLAFQALLDEAFKREPRLWDWIALSPSHRQDEVDKMILETLADDAIKWPERGEKDDASRALWEQSFSGAK